MPSSIGTAPAPEVKPQVITDPTSRHSSSTPVKPEEVKKPRRSYRPDEIERKAEELRKRALNFSPQYAPHKKPELTISEKHPIKLPLSEEEALDFVDHRNEKKLPGVEILTGVLVTAFVAACVIGGRALFLQKSTTQPKIAARAVSIDEHTAKKPSTTVPITITFDSTQIKPQIDTVVAVVKPKPKTVRPNNQVMVAAMNEETNKVSEILPPVKDDATNSAQSVTKSVGEELKQDDNSKAEDAKDQTTHESTATPQPEEKKKGFLKGLFKKKKKNE